MPLEDRLATEARHPGTEGIDQQDALAIARWMNDEDARVVDAVREVTPAIARAIDETAARLQRGGRLIYVGAGTSGRLGVLDATECPPTFGTPPGLVIGLIAGGTAALTRAIENAEDDAEAGARDLAALTPSAADLVVGIATSGRTPYVLGAVRYTRGLGSFTIGIACNRPSLLGTSVDLEIAPVVGPEIIAGSTRLKAGTATKMILNMISTGAMIRLGKTLGNRMVDLQPLNEKLRIRSMRLLRELTGLDETEARACLAAAEGQLKPAIVMALTGLDRANAVALLESHGGQIRDAVRAHTGQILP